MRWNMKMVDYGINVFECECGVYLIFFNNL